MSDEDFARHNARMKRVAEARAGMQARRTLERGLLIVHTGPGKGKPSSAFGMAIRSLGWGMNVAILQYVKGKWETGERTLFEANPDLATFEVMGEGTGRNAKPELLEIADFVTEFGEVKRPYKAGFKAQMGVEY